MNSFKLCQIQWWGIVIVSILCLSQLSGQEVFRGHIVEQSYDIYHRPSKTSLFSAMSRASGVPLDYIDTITTDYYVCSDTIISITKVIEYVNAVEVAEYGGYQYIYDFEGDKYIKMPIRTIQVEETETKKWRGYNKMKYDTEMKYNAKLNLSPNGKRFFLARIDESSVFKGQAEIQGRFAKVFNDRGVYKAIVHKLGDSSAVFSSYHYKSNPGLNCEDFLRHVSIKEIDESVVPGGGTLKFIIPESRRSFVSGNYIDITGQSFSGLNRFYGPYRFDGV